jgi:4-amino-4-deoxy-L-arabinose transferase-like glycosyltransferase
LTLAEKMLRTNIIFNDLGILMMLALLRFFLHLLTNGQYGFHRDELATLDDARYLAWGYVAYPPVTPFIARLAIELFGPSLIGVRLFSALAQSVVMVLAGLMTHELGGSRLAQIVTALAVAIAPISLLQGALFQYVSFDYLWWVLIAYLTIRLLKSENPRWWLGIGAVIGVGMMTRYTMAFFVAGIVGGVLLTQTRRYLTSAWLWGGVTLSLLIFLPNLIWQIQHDFISQEFLSSIHARDVELGRTEGFLNEQFFVCVNLFTIPLWVAGLYYYFFSPAGARYRMLGWMYLIPLLLFFVFQGRSYYLAPAYPMLIAAGVVTWEQWLAKLSSGWARLGWGVTWVALAVGAILGGALMLPIAPVNSDLWNITSEVHDNFVEQIGWPELVETVAEIYATLPTTEQTQTGILTGNYGEAGAINLYGPAYGLPEAISGINSYWLRGYGDPPPQTLIVVGYSRNGAERFFEQCDLAGQITNRYGVENEETKFHPDIFICREPRQSWLALWQSLKHFG